MGICHGVIMTVVSEQSVARLDPEHFVHVAVELQNAVTK